MHFDAIIRKEGKLYSSWCPQLDIASSGKTIEEARSNLKEAIELYLEDEDAIIPTDDISLTLTSVEVLKNDKTSRSLRQ
jgi:predicted RNase H-like HicB family nuclease